MQAIVIIEDDGLMRSLLAEWLTTEGYQVRAVDGEQERPFSLPKLVIVDVYMPRHLGFERLRSARSDYPGVPIIAISGQFRADVKGAGSAAQALGVDRIIAKPLGREALLREVRSLIGPPVVASG